MKDYWKRLLAALVACFLLVSGVLPALAEEAFEGIEFEDESVAEVLGDQEILAELAEDPVYEEEGEFDLMTPEMIGGEAAVEAEEGIDLYAAVEPEDGEQEVLAEEEACTHEGYGTHTDWDYEYEYTDIPENNRTHSVTEYYIEWKICDNCYKEIPGTRTREVNESWTSSHSYDASGVCTVCGHVNSCAHTELYESITWNYEKERTYTPVDERTHMITGSAFRRNRCAECGIIIGDAVEFDRTAYEDHDYVNGVCEDCKYACTHSKTTTNKSTRNGTYENIPEDNYYHKATGETWESTVCWYCNSTIVEAHATGAYETDVGQHNYDSTGVCRDCGHVCTHVNVRTRTFWSYEEGTEYTYVPIDDHYHYQSRATNLVSYCTDCGMDITTTPTDARADKDTHSYVLNESGAYVCSECGHVCTHSKTRNNDSRGDITYTEVNDRYHNRSYEEFRTVECDYCNAVVSPKASLGVKTDSAEHNYSQGVCTNCRHVCAHASTYETLTLKNARVVDNGSDDYHSRVGEEFVQVVCNDCGKVISETSNGEQTKRDEHSYSSYDGYEQCWECGHIRNCAHLFVHHDYGYFGLSTYVSVDELYHTRTTRAWEYDYCDVCGLKVDERIIDSYTEPEEEHNYDDSGVCKDCGHVRACTHVNVREYRRWDSSKDIVYADAGDYHTVTGTRIVKRYCLDCGTSLDDVVLGEVTIQENHWGDSGFCVDCSHPITCAHDGTTHKETYWNETPIYAAVDEARHSATSQQICDTVCDLCHTRLKREIINEKTEYYSHDYGENGKICSTCGHVNACAHANTFDYYEWDEDGATPIEGNYSQHMRIGYQTGYTKCLDCGIRLNEWNKRVQLGLEDHYYDDFGRCTECDYINNCPHARTYDTYEWKTDPVYAVKDNEVHTETAEQYKEVVCADCGMTISKVYAGVVTEEYTHTFVDGVCTECGHVYTCPHKDTVKKIVFGRNAVYPVEQRTAKTHGVSGYRYEQVRCLDCGKLLSSTALGEGSATENHSYDKYGRCACGITSNVYFFTSDVPATMAVGEKYSLTTKAFDLRDKSAKMKFTYASSNKKVVTVSKKGVLTAKKKGTADITITAANGMTDTIRVTVKKLATKFKLSAKKKTLTLKTEGKDTFQLIGKFSKKTYAPLTFTTSDKKVAKVDKYGIVTAVGAGKCTITAKISSGATATCTVTVKDPNAPKSVFIMNGTKRLKKNAKLSVKKGKTIKLTYVLKPENATKGVTWTSSDTKVAKVSKKGVVKAVGKGKATITVTTKNGKKAKVVVTVK